MNNSNVSFPEALDVTVVSKSFTGESGVNARSLHKFLESGTRFNDWINRAIINYRFEKNSDYVVHYFDLSGNFLGNSRILKKEYSENQVHRKEYEITMDMAKELAMVERSEKGRLARKYYISLERYVNGIDFSINIFEGKEWVTIDEYCEYFDVNPQSFHGSKPHYKHFFSKKNNLEVVHARVCHMREMRQKLETEKKVLRSPKLIDANQMLLEFPEL